MCIRDSFWPSGTRTNPAVPTGLADFQGIVNQEFGPRTLTTGRDQMTYYLAIDQDLEQFMYSINGSNIPSEDEVLRDVDRNGTTYRVIRFENALPNSNIVVT